MSPQEQSLEALFAIAERRKDPALLRELVEWAERNLQTCSAILDIGKPIAMCSIRDQHILKRRLLQSFAEGLTSQNYDSYVEGKGNTLVMRVLMLGPKAGHLPEGKSIDLMERMKARLLSEPLKELSDERPKQS